MKKLLAILLVICMLAAILAACADNGNGDMYSKDSNSVGNSNETESETDHEPTQNPGETTGDNSNETESKTEPEPDLGEDLPNNGSEGLEYVLNSDGTGYNVAGVGTCNDTVLVIPDTHKGLPVTGISRVAFRYDSSITSVTIGNNVTSIGREAFYGCSRLTILTIGDGVTTISTSAFLGCGGLTSVTVGSSVESINSGAFENCDKLVEVINRSSLDITAGSKDNGRIAYCAKEVHSGESKLVNQNDYIFYTYDGVDYMIGYVGSEKELILPESYNGQNYKIHDCAFYGYIGLKGITIPESVTEISQKAFLGCSNIETATVHPTAAFYIPKDSLKTVIIIGGSRIDDFAFYDSLTLENVTIDNSITSIGEWVFKGCGKLKNITYNGSVEQWKAIDKGYGWNSETDAYTVTCADGVLTKAEN